MPFEDWSIADLKCKKDFLINGDPDFSGNIFRGVSEWEEKHSELRADKKILTGAIDRTVDRLVDKLDIGSKIEENVCENMPNENQIEQEVQRIYRG